MTRGEALLKTARVRRALNDAIARAIDEDRDDDFDRLVHAIESFDELSSYLIRRLTE